MLVTHYRFHNIGVFKNGLPDDEHVNFDNEIYIDFFKYHALGNDYIVIDPRRTELEINPETVRNICHRNYGIGSDGILYGPVKREGEIYLTIFNPDGSEAEISGNGIRIFSRYLIDNADMDQESFTLNTGRRSVAVEIVSKEPALFKVDMGPVSFLSTDIPVEGDPREVVNEVVTVNGEAVNATCVTVGNPHCVIPMKQISSELARELGPLIENHNLFPQRINMQLLQILDRSNIRIEIWERGAGYTLASGSSSCAAASVAFKLGLVDRQVTVHMPGGILKIEMAVNGNVYQTGPVAGVCTGSFDPEFREILSGKDKLAQL